MASQHPKVASQTKSQNKQNWDPEKEKRRQDIDKLRLFIRPPHDRDCGPSQYRNSGQESDEVWNQRMQAVRPKVDSPGAKSAEPEKLVGGKQEICQAGSTKPPEAPAPCRKVQR